MKKTTKYTGWSVKQQANKFHKPHQILTDFKFLSPALRSKFIIVIIKGPTTSQNVSLH